MKLRTVDSLLPEMNDGDLRAPVPRSLWRANSQQFDDVCEVLPSCLLLLLNPGW